MGKVAIRELFKIMRREGHPFKPLQHKHWIHRVINEKAKARAILDNNVEDGKIAVYRSGRDCDGVEYDKAYITDAPTGVVEFIRSEEEHYQWLDGPERTHFGKPSKCEPFSEMCDLVMEAYENGHPHVIYSRFA
jgi:hypothetical protein